MFERIDKEEDGEVYVREVVEFLRVLDNNLEQSQEGIPVREIKLKENTFIYLSFICRLICC